jgi:asparagine synthase (glutamine-hydrolysing)
MCGINGIYGLRDEFRTRDLLVHMNSKLAHRGPDAQGIVTRGAVGFGHRRLSIIDLSEAGRQPMANGGANIFITYNGEIYNFKQLRALCRSYEFKTDTDTEVILALYEQHGEKCFEMLDGMFAIAIWDDRNKKLVLVRDRVGKKPLYYSWNKEILVFSSEIRALLASGLVAPTLRRDTLDNYFQYQTVYGPDTILENIQSIPAGSYAIIQGGITDVKKYWTLEKAREKHALTGPYDKVVKQTRELFFQAVEKRLISDVPLGAFLSGGIDSTAVVAAMARLSDAPVKTFNIYFDDAEFNESSYAEMVAKKFRTDHHAIKVTADDFLSLLPEALKAMDHPGVDGPNSYVVSKYARQAGITVALSGLGGDEIFGGYPVFQYVKALHKWRALGKTPVFMRLALAKMLRKRLPANQSMRIMQLAEMKKWDLTSVYTIFRSVLSSAELKMLGMHPDGYKGLVLQNDNPQKILSEVSIAECKTYLENVLLRDTDQMSMAHGLEVRVPFLDKDLLEFVLSLPDDFKPLKPGKKLIIDAMGDLLPEEIWNRKKMGFTFPWKRWVNRELKGFCEENLEFLADNHVLHTGYVGQLKDSLETPENENWIKVWNAVVLGNWLRTNNIEIGKETGSYHY